MSVQIVAFPHPTLRHKSKPIKRVDAELKSIVGEMFDLMYAASGVGLAANQVDLPLRLFVANEKADPAEGDPLVFINPVISRAKGSEVREEGCLSLPELYGDVRRPEKVFVTAYNLQGELFEGEVSGLLGRIIQHETDHLDGVLFIDRLSETGAMKLAPALDEFLIDFESKRRTGEIPSDEAIAARLAEIEQRYC
ncbi:MAG: peptide deformylase [Planctomycetales bacterium]|nr:peptide deformylase [Planctomycetales bacterium]